MRKQGSTSKKEGRRQKKRDRDEIGIEEGYKGVKG